MSLPFFYTRGILLDVSPSFSFRAPISVGEAIWPSGEMQKREGSLLEDTTMETLSAYVARASLLEPPQPVLYWDAGSQTFKGIRPAGIRGGWLKAHHQSPLSLFGV